MEVIGLELFHVLVANLFHILCPIFIFGVGERVINLYLKLTCNVTLPGTRV